MTKNKNEKIKDKTDNNKTKYDRVMEIVKAWKQLRELGFPDETPALVEFKRITNLFIDDGIPSTGKLPMDEYDRTLCYILTNRKNKESTIALMANKKTDLRF